MSGNRVSAGGAAILGHVPPAYSSSYAFLDHPGPIPFAHRGGSLDGRENTMAAFERAVSLGYRYLETDAHATADGVLLAIHDATLDRVADRPGRVDALPYRDAVRVRIGGEPIPRVDDLLAAFPDARFNIDVKADTSVVPLIDVLRRTGAWDRVCVASFSTRRLRRVRAITGGRLCTSLGPTGIAALTAGAAPAGAGCAQVPVPLVSRAFLATAHRRGLPVHAWTVNDRARMERLLDLGVDGIISDDIETLRDVLTGRGLWR